MGENAHNAYLPCAFNVAPIKELMDIKIRYGIIIDAKKELFSISCKENPGAKKEIT